MIEQVKPVIPEADQYLTLSELNWLLKLIGNELQGPTKRFGWPGHLVSAKAKLEAMRNTGVLQAFE
jgi:hypothetical protein